MRSWCAGVLACASVLALGPAAADTLKAQPSRNVDLGGTWQLDSARSDDPAEILERAAQAEEARRNRTFEERRRPGGGIFNDCDEDPWERDLPGDRPPILRDYRRPCIDRPFPRPDPDDSVLRRRQEQEPPPANEFLLQLDPNPDTLTIVVKTPRVSVFEGKLETACTAGATEPFSDVFGDGERRCGWSARAFVMETQREKRFKRVDRFELGDDGATLRYTSTVSGPKMRSVRVKRIYKRTGSAAG